MGPLLVHAISMCPLTADVLFGWIVSRSFHHRGAHLEANVAETINDVTAMEAIDQLDHTLRIISYLSTNVINHAAFERIDHRYTTDRCCGLIVHSAFCLIHVFVQRICPNSVLCQ
jgi:hypothetical protein